MFKLLTIFSFLMFFSSGVFAKSDCSEYGSIDSKENIRSGCAIGKTRQKHADSFERCCKVDCSKFGKPLEESSYTMCGNDDLKKKNPIGYAICCNTKTSGVDPKCASINNENTDKSLIIGTSGKDGSGVVGKK